MYHRSYSDRSHSCWRTNELYGMSQNQGYQERQIVDLVVMNKAMDKHTYTHCLNWNGFLFSTMHLTDKSSKNIQSPSCNYNLRVAGNICNINTKGNDLNIYTYTKKGMSDGFVLHLTQYLEYWMDMLLRRTTNKRKQKETNKQTNKQHAGNKKPMTHTINLLKLLWHAV